MGAMGWRRWRASRCRSGPTASLGLSCISCSQSGTITMTSDLGSLLTNAGLAEKAQHDVPRVVNRLLGQTFVYQDVDGDKDDYYLVHRHRPVFEQLLGLAGFKLLHDDYHR